MQKELRREQKCIIIDLFIVVPEIKQKIRRSQKRERRILACLTEKMPFRNYHFYAFRKENAAAHHYPDISTH